MQYVTIPGLEAAIEAPAKQETADLEKAALHQVTGIDQGSTYHPESVGRKMGGAAVVIQPINMQVDGVDKKGVAICCNREQMGQVIKMHHGGGAMATVYSLAAQQSLVFPETCVIAHVDDQGNRALVSGDVQFPDGQSKSQEIAQPDSPPCHDMRAFIAFREKIIKKSLMKGNEKIRLSMV